VKLYFFSLNEILKMPKPLGQGDHDTKTSDIPFTNRSGSVVKSNAINESITSGSRIGGSSNRSVALRSLDKSGAVSQRYVV
jgi:hypothetical protein